MASTSPQGTLVRDLTTARSDETSWISIHRHVMLIVSVWLLVSFPSDAQAHAIPNALTLHDLCRNAEIVAVGRITRAPKPEPNASALPPVEAEIIEFLREGDAPKGSLRFLSHRHGNDEYVIGEELLLFLESVRSPERAQEAKYEAIDAIGDRFVVPADRRDVWIDAARKYAALGKGPRTATDARALGRISIAMLASSETKLAQLALRDLTLASSTSVLAESDVPELLRVVDDATRSSTVRVGILSELERRKLTPVGTHWVSVLDSAPANERSVVISGAKSRWFVPEVNAALVSLVESTSPSEAISAARAVGAEGNEAAVEALGRAVLREPAELRFAALGSLRRINSATAREKLEAFAQTHPDAETRKVAQTEKALLPATPVAPKNLGGTNLAPATMTSGHRRIVFVVVGLVVVFIVIGLGKQAQRAKLMKDED